MGIEAVGEALVEEKCVEAEEKGAEASVVESGCSDVLRVQDPWCGLNWVMVGRVGGGGGLASEIHQWSP